MAEKNKYTLLEHLKKLALRERLDYITLITEALAGELSPGITVTLPANSWNDKTQKVSDDRFLADIHHWYIVGGDADCLGPFLDAGIMAKNVTTAGEMTFTCATVPEEDLTVNIIRLEVETENE